MTIRNIQCNNLFEELIERGITSCDEKRTLVGEIVVDVADDLNSNVGFSGSRGSDNDC